MGLRCLGDVVLIGISLLSADFSCLKEELERIECGGADFLHLDIMDGNFSPGFITFGPGIIKKMRPHTGLSFDVHLMVHRPDLYICLLKDAGVSSIGIHPSSDGNFLKTLRCIKDVGCEAGVVFSPDEEYKDLPREAWDVIDFVNIMTVYPKMEKQDFLRDRLFMISAVRKAFCDIRPDRRIRVIVDGGITDSTALLCVQHDIDAVIVGGFAFSSFPYKIAIDKIRKACAF
ncbi:ribulose-phosphate 3-epimerase [Candidatus Hydrogenosomobacter endosymbioticus]|nr:ribulose-phosphate 3-epimerase [Candidatus Hydrogenosomobacter endosymbioticus]